MPEQGGACILPEMKITAAAAAILTALLSREGHAQTPAAPAAASIPAGVVEALEKQVLYHPRKYTPAAVQSFTASGGKRLDYQTSQGRQTAWIITPKESTVPERLWIICDGNATLVLELAAFCRAQAFPMDAWLLVDYPGFGECAGQPSPQGFRENFKTCVPLAAAQLKLPGVGGSDSTGSISRASS